MYFFYFFFYGPRGRASERQIGATEDLPSCSLFGTRRARSKNLGVIIVSAKNDDQAARVAQHNSRCMLTEHTTLWTRVRVLVGEPGRGDFCFNNILSSLIINIYIISIYIISASRNKSNNCGIYSHSQTLPEPESSLYGYKEIPST